MQTLHNDATGCKGITQNNVVLKVLRKLRVIYHDLFRLTSTSASFLWKRTKILKIAVVLIGLMFLSGTISGFMLAQVMSTPQSKTSFSNVGNLNSIGVGIYWDAGFTNRVTAIDWGTIYPGNQKNFTFFILNEGNAPITLSLTVTNWSPATASNFLTLSWNYNSQSINADGYVQVALTLTASSSTNISSFSFDATILGS